MLLCRLSGFMLHKSIYDRVVSGVSDIADKIKVGPGLDPATEMGPQESDEHVHLRHQLHRVRWPHGGCEIAVGVHGLSATRPISCCADGDGKHHAQHEGHPRGDHRPGGLCNAVR